MASDPTLVLLPGLDGTGILFSPLLSALPRDLASRVVAYPSDPTLTLEGYARLAMAAFPPGPVVLVAESFSGRVALAVLATGDLRVVGVVLVGAFARSPWPAKILSRVGPVMGLAARHAPDSALRRWALGRDAPADLLGLFRSAVASVPGTVLARRLRLLGTPPPAPELAFTTPCLYLQAAHDRLIPDKAPESLRPWFASLPVRSIPGPHFLLQARPQVCSAAVVDFLSRCASPTPFAIRSFVPGDAPALAAVYRDTVRGQGPRAYDTAQVEAWAAYPEDLEEFRDRLGQGLTLVAEGPEGPAAFGQLHPEHHIALLYCATRWSGQGLGSRIYRRLEARARARGVARLDTDASRLSRPFFERHGFHVVAVDHPVRHGVVFERFRMEKRLDA